jgi:hypothetical protein
MESIPFLHANRIFTILFWEDLAFVEVRSILDRLLEDDAFNPVVQEVAGCYFMELGDASFEVWVQEMNVAIQKK